MVFENGVKNIQAAAYNGARTVVENGLRGWFLIPSNYLDFLDQIFDYYNWSGYM